MTNAFDRELPLELSSESAIRVPLFTKTMSFVHDANECIVSKLPVETVQRVPPSTDRPMIVCTH